MESWGCCGLTGMNLPACADCAATRRRSGMWSTAIVSLSSLHIRESVVFKANERGKNVFRSEQYAKSRHCGLALTIKPSNQWARSHLKLSALPAIGTYEYLLIETIYNLRYWMITFVQIFRFSLEHGTCLFHFRSELSLLKVGWPPRVAAPG